MSFRSEFKLQNFRLRHDNIEDFYTLKICGVTRKLWILRLVFFIYTLVCLIYSIVKFNDPKWFIFLTSWGNTIIVIYFLLGLLVFAFMDKEQKPANRTPEIEMSSPDGSEDDVTFRAFSSTTALPFKVQAYWMFAYFAYILNGLVVLLYWTFVHQDKFVTSTAAAYSIINSHGITYVLVLIDFVLSKIPIRLLHSVYVVLLGMLYGIFSLVFTSASGQWIYPVLKWNSQPVEALLFCLIALSVILLFHVIFYGLHILRKKFISNTYSVA